MNKPSNEHRKSKRADAKAADDRANTATSATRHHQPRIPAGRYLLYFGALTAGCFADLASKQWVFAKYHQLDPRSAPEAHWWVDGWLGIQTSVNQGALFGMGQGKSLWFAALSCAALVGIIYWLFFRRGAWDLWLTGALGAISGGILGNLYDRLGLWHGMARQTWQGEPVPTHSIYGVRDWIHFRWEGSPISVLDPWPNFNIADSLLVCGAIALFLHAVFSKGPAGPPHGSTSDADAATAERTSSRHQSESSSGVSSNSHETRPHRGSDQTRKVSSD